MPFLYDESLALKFPRLKQVNLESGRVYVAEDGAHAGDVLPSITRVLAAKPKPQLEAWKVRKGPEEAELIRARASNRGNGLHHVSECYLGNLSMPKVWPHVAELWRFLQPWLTEHVTKVYGQEQNLCSFVLGVGGRTDLIADVDGVFSIVDFKQADKPKKDETVQDYYLQGTFYACAVYEHTRRLPKQIVLPVASPEGLQMFVTDPNQHLAELRGRIAEFWQLTR
jgi:hypothetical protein